MKSKVFTLKNCFINYPYKDQNITNTVPIPYIKSKDLVTDHEYSITYKEYCEIIRSFLYYLFEYLKYGSTFVIPHSLGKLTIKKYKGKYFDYKTLTPNTFSDKLGGLKFKIIWRRGVKDGGKCKNKWKWRCYISKTKWVELFEFYRNNFIALKKLDDVFKV
jgi:hypothetical protein